MKTILIAVALLTTSIGAYAACTTTTLIQPNGSVVMCTTCCFNGNCTVTCL
mgnify:CR=1 FL=1